MRGPSCAMLFIDLSFQKAILVIGLSFFKKLIFHDNKIPEQAL
jgi:hypothetical protein